MRPGGNGAGGGAGRCLNAVGEKLHAYNNNGPRQDLYLQDDWEPVMSRVRCPKCERTQKVGAEYDRTILPCLSCGHKIRVAENLLPEGAKSKRRKRRSISVYVWLGIVVVAALALLVIVLRYRS
jgi:ribosomal protein S27E